MTSTTPELAPGYDPGRVREAIRDNLFIHFTQMQSHYAPEHRPLVLVKGDGSTVWDMDGNAYLDLLAGIYSVNAGYGRRRIVEAMLAQLEAAGSAWGIVTNKPEYLARQLLPLLGWETRCAVLIGGDTLGVRKPDPLPLTVAATRIGIAPGECIYVGDDERDIIAARAAGMPSVVALWGYRVSGDDPAAWNGDVMVARPVDLCAAAAWPGTR